MPVCLDTQILVWGGIRGFAKDGAQRPAHAERSRWLLNMLDRDRVPIIVPTIVAAEMAVPVPQMKRGDFLEKLSHSFLVKPFDLHAAAIAAELHHAAMSLPTHQRPACAVLAADVKIIATARAAGASVFYSADWKCRQIAEHVMDARDLPKAKDELFD